MWIYMCSHFKHTECSTARISIDPSIEGFLLDTPQDTGYVSKSVYKRGTHQLVPSYTLATGR
jgi:hypothetical protein